MSSDFTDLGTKLYEIRQLDNDGALLSSSEVEAPSSEAAARQLRDVVDGAETISVCLDGKAMNEMGVEFWQKRVRRR